jgi:hypothetical protein
VVTYEGGSSSVPTLQQLGGANTAAAKYYLLDNNYSVGAVADATGSTIEPRDFAPLSGFVGVSRDFDGDHDVDDDDLDALAACWSGPDTDVASDCAAKDLDRDNDVDATDYVLFQPCMSGSGVPATLECTQAAPPNGSFAVHGLTVDVIPNGPTLVFARARHYDVKHGRWLQRDPKGYVDGPNLYEAFGGNPLANVDPMGEDSISEETDADGNGWLVYESSAWHQGFRYDFARLISPDYVVIDHPSWRYAFIMRKDAAISLFNRWVWQSDFSDPLEMMQFATAVATRAGTGSAFKAILDKGSKTPGWRRPEQVKEDEDFKHHAQGGLMDMAAGAGTLVQFSYTTVTGALAAPAGLPAAVVDATSTAVDMVRDRDFSAAKITVVAVTAAGLYLHLSFADDAASAGTRLPKGFAGESEYARFGQRLHTGLDNAGYRDAQALFQGSAVTGRSFRTGIPFDVGRVSDYDIALASPALLDRAKSLGIPLRSGGTRTGPLAAHELKALGIDSVARDLTREAGRPVKFMVFGSPADAIVRAPSSIIPR